MCVSEEGNAARNLGEKLMSQSRAEIDRLDREILDLLNQRAKASLGIARAKQAAGADIFVPEREESLVRSLVGENAGPLPDASVKAVFREIISACRSLQSPMKVAFLGPEFTYSHQAALKRFGQSSKMDPKASIAQVFKAVESGTCQAGLVPVENSTEGAVGAAMDAFLNTSLKVCGEVFDQINHVLMSRTSDHSQVKVVYSHPQALAQCRKWLERTLPGAELVETGSTSAAAAKAASQADAAAVGSRLAAESLGLNLLAENIQDISSNITRFLVLCKQDCPSTGEDKTSLLFVGSHKPGSLHNALGHLAKNGLNLTRIESRPTRQKAWEYAFFVDLQGHKDDAAVQNALEDMKGNVLWLKVLGSYPQGQNPTE